MPPSIYPESWGSDESELWEDIAGNKQGDYDAFLSEDRTAMALFSAGWLEDGTENRMLIRDAFFDYAIEEGYLYDRDEFDWEVWREYMGY